jgi:hypothetical protein
MASTISAGTTSGTAIAITGDTTGNLAFQTSAGTYTQTMPNATGTVMVSGNMPAFGAYLGSTQSISASTYTKVQFNTEEFDTASAYDNATNYRFTPLVAGYYQVNAVVTGSGTAIGSILMYLYKNGSAYKRGSNAAPNNTANGADSGSYIVYLNGSTDYIEIYGYISGGTGTAFNGSSGSPVQQECTFSACLIRVA